MDNNIVTTKSSRMDKVINLYFKHLKLSSISLNYLWYVFSQVLVGIVWDSEEVVGQVLYGLQD